MECRYEQATLCMGGGRWILKLFAISAACLEKNVFIRVLFIKPKRLRQTVKSCAGVCKDWESNATYDTIGKSSEQLVHFSSGNHILQSETTLCSIFSPAIIKTTSVICRMRASSDCCFHHCWVTWWHGSRAEWGKGILPSQFS